jgi:hypothetical protein
VRHPDFNDMPLLLTGAPQFGHILALLLTSRPHSLHRFIAIAFASLPGIIPAAHGRFVRQAASPLSKKKNLPRRASALGSVLLMKSRASATPA